GSSYRTDHPPDREWIDHAKPFDVIPHLGPVLHDSRALLFCGPRYETGSSSSSRASIKIRAASVRTRCARNDLHAKRRFKEQIHWLRRKQLLIYDDCNWIELPYVIRPGEFNFQPSALPVITNIANLYVLHGLNV